jgi:hypothetical protein
MLARWFMPAADGVSLWDASQLAAQIEALPPEEVAAFADGAARRQAAIREFPQYGGEIAAAENAWVTRCVETAVSSTEGLVGQDAARATARLRECQHVLARLAKGANLKELQTARRDLLNARINRVKAELEVLVKEGEFAAVADHAAERLGDLDREARELGMRDDIVRQITPVRARAVQARLASVAKVLETAVGRGNYSLVATEGRKAEDELHAEAEACGIAGEVKDQLLAIRRKAVQKCLEAAREDTKALLAKDRFEAVAKLGDGLAHTLTAEAEAVGCGRDLREFCHGCKVFGDLAQQAGK